MAGKRAGIKHAANGDEEVTRSGLFMEAVRIIKEMREATNGKYPRFALWENVPGAFSSNKGEDFRIVCEEIIKIVEPQAVMPEVPKTGWPYADCYSGNGWSLAYRTFDAQYWGVPQRRRRIHLVADFSGECAAEILFKREGVRGYHAQSGKTWQGAATNAESSVGTTDAKCYGISSYDSNAMKSANPHSGIYEAGTSRTLDLNGGNPACNQGGIAIVEPVGMDGYNGDLTGDKAATLGVNCGISTGRNGVIQPICMATQQGGAEIRTDDKVPTLTAAAGMSGNNQPVICMPVVIDSIGGQGENAKETDVAPTLKASHYKSPPSIALSAGFCTEHSAQAGGIGYQEECAPTLRAGVTPATVCSTYDARGNGNGTTVNTITGDHENRITDYSSVVVQSEGILDRPAMAYAIDVGFLNSCEEQSPTLLARGYKDPRLVTYPKEEVRYTVRRLTPTECARLQGFADGWGHIYPKDDLTDDEYAFWLDVRNTHAAINGKKVKEYTKAQMLTWYNKLHSDSAEYKMWGNGIALPPALYCMQGIADAIRREAVH